jgi:hypothetical protein
MRFDIQKAWYERGDSFRWHCCICAKKIVHNERYVQDWGALTNGHYCIKCAREKLPDFIKWLNAEIAECRGEIKALKKELGASK